MARSLQSSREWAACSEVRLPVKIWDNIEEIRNGIFGIDVSLHLGAFPKSIGRSALKRAR
jgi:hypothetical protein